MLGLIHDPYFDLARGSSNRSCAVLPAGYFPMNPTELEARLKWLEDMVNRAEVLVSQVFPQPRKKQWQREFYADKGIPMDQGLRALGTAPMFPRSISKKELG